MSEPTAELKPCPFCGANKANVGDEDGFFFVICPKCFCQTSDCGRETGAIEDWNRRAPSTEAEAICTCKDNGIPWHDAPDCPLRSCLSRTPEEQEIDRLTQQLERVTKEREEALALVESAYIEGCVDGVGAAEVPCSRHELWLGSEAKAALARQGGQGS